MVFSDMKLAALVISFLKYPRGTDYLEYYKG